MNERAVCATLLIGENTESIASQSMNSKQPFVSRPAHDALEAKNDASEAMKDAPKAINDASEAMKDAQVAVKDARAAMKDARANGVLKPGGLGKPGGPDPVSYIRDTIGYEFINENLMRQAFTRRAFGTVYGVGNSEELEFLGDSVLNMIVTREMARQFSEVVTIHPHAPFQSRYSEGEMTKIRSRSY